MKIAVVGKMRSGKDTLARFFEENDDAYKMAFGDGIKRVCALLFPVQVAQGKPRELYQEVGQYFRTIDPLVWIKYLDNNMEIHKLYGQENFVISDVRQMNEYEYLKAEGFTIIKVEAEDEIRKKRIIASGDQFEEKHFYHETELTVDTLPYDYLVTNNDTYDSFLDQIKYVYNDLKGEEHGIS
jgi:dephospho-CoA kinase